MGVADLSDEALMQAVRDGDVDKLGVLFERHHARVHALCYRLTRRDDVADDLAQETMLRVLRNASAFRGDSAFATWLYRVAVNVCQDHWRRSARDETIATVPGIGDDRPGSDAGLSDRQVVLDVAMHRLHPDHRMVLVLNRYHDLSYDDIGRVLDCTPSAARVRAHRALNELREICRDLERRRQPGKTNPSRAS